MFRTESAWESISAHEMLRRVAGLSKALVGTGHSHRATAWQYSRRIVRNGISRISRFKGLGGVTVPVYFNESQDA